MNLRVLVVLAAVLTAIPLTDSRAGWGAGCAPVGATRFSGWDYSQSGWGQYFRDGQLLGAFSFSTHRWYPWEGNAWGKPTAPPWAETIAAPRAKCPDCRDGCSCRKCEGRCECTESGACETNGCNCALVARGGKPVDLLRDPGLISEKVKHAAEEEYRLNGRTISKKQAHRLLEAEGRGKGGDIPDDSKLLRLTVIGSADECKPVLADVDALRLRDQLVIQVYRPEHWAVARAGFFTAGHPTIYLQAPDGKVIHRQDSYAGPEQLSEAVRKANPAYDPKKDRDLTKTVIPQLPPAALATIGFAALFGMLLIFGKGRP